MKKSIIFILGGLFLMSCKKEEATTITTTKNYPPVYVKIQAVNKDSVITESNILITR